VREYADMTHREGRVRYSTPDQKKEAAYRAYLWHKALQARGIYRSPLNISPEIQTEYPDSVQPILRCLKARSEAERRDAEAKFLVPHLQRLANETVKRGEHQKLPKYGRLAVLRMAMGQLEQM
jgi:hypothetical protein